MKLVESLIACCIFSSCVIAQDCVWNRVTEFPTEWPPLLIELSTWQAYLPVVENGENVVRIAEGTTVVVACPGETLIAIGGEVAEGICQAGSLVINGEDYHISDLACDARVDDDAVIYDDQTCANGEGTLNGIGFNVAGYQFYETIEICFDTIHKITITAKHVIYGKSVDARESNDGPSFKMGNGFYDFNPNNCYLTANQDAYFDELLDDPDYIDLNSNKYFSRGHLAPNAAFVIEMEADASYYYLNAIPQWQDYNGQNWMYAEAAVRNIASAHGTDLDVWTGPYGQFVLEGEPIFHCASQGSDTIPTPELIWKIVYEEETNRGLAIVISNLPYEEFPLIICPDLDCESIDWVVEEVFEPRVLTRGYTYCCTVQDLKSAVPNAPDLPDDVDILVY